MRIGLVVVLLVACGGHAASPSVANVAPDDEPPQATAIRGFVEALAAGDVARAQGFLPDDASCALARPAFVDGCKQTASVERKTVPAIRDVPKNAHVTAVHRVQANDDFPEIEYWTFDLDGEAAGELMTVPLGGKSYVLLIPQAFDM